MTDRQMLVLRSLFTDHAAMKRFLPVIKPEHFGTAAGARFLCEVLLSHYREFGQMPSQEEAYITIKHTRGPQEVVDEAIELLQQCHAERDERPNPEWLEKQIHRFLDDAETVRAVTDFIEEENDDDPKKAKRDPEQLTSERLLKSIARVYDIRQMLADRPLAGISFKDSAYVHAKMHSKEERFSTGLSTLDGLTDGGLARTQVGIVSAGSGVGKSMMLCHLAAEAARGGANVLYLNLESIDTELQARVACNLANISSYTYKLLSPEQHAALFDRCDAHGAVVVRDLVVSAKPSDLSGAAEEFRWAHGKYPDVIIVDYLGELEPERQGKSDTTYTTGASTMKNLMKLGKRTNAAIWTAAQINREGLKKSKSEGKEKPDATHMADSIAPHFKSTLAGMLSLIPQKGGDDNVGFLRWTTEKYRFRSKRPEMILRLDYPYAKFTELDEKQAVEVLANAAGATTVVEKVEKTTPSQWAFNMERGEQRRNITKLKVD